MKIRLDGLVTPEQANALRTVGVDKLAMADLEKLGMLVEDFNLRTAVQALATRDFIKNAQYRAIVEGLAALAMLE